MMREQLCEAVKLRSTGHAEEARVMLVELAAKYPDDADMNYQTAWVHDILGREREALPFYVRAIELGLEGEDLEGALLGLGSTYRILGDYERAEVTLRRGLKEFPQRRVFQIFLAMTLYNLERYHDAMELVLTNLAETTSDVSILHYKEAILSYGTQLDHSWDEE